MAINPEAQALLDQYASLGAKPLRELGILKARAAVAGSVMFAGERERVHRVMDETIDAGDRAIPIRRYQPTDTPLATIVYLHGGGWMTGDVATADPACRSFANVVNCEVVSVEYRRSPETRHPGPLEDGAAVLRHVAHHLPRPIFLAGDSAGGGLAAGLALIARDESIDLAGQILLYPALTPEVVTGNPNDGEGRGLSRGDMAFFWQHYLGDAQDHEGYGAPLLVEDLSGLAPALIIAAEIDILREENERYAARLSDAGCSVDLSIQAGMIHGFFWQFGAVPSARTCLETIHAFVEAHLS